MAIYRVKLKRRREIASGTMAFYFAKPQGFSYQAGQLGDFTLANPPETDAEGNTRTFTLASAPYEGDLMVATRMRDTAFKRVFKTMALDTEISLNAPNGELTLHEDARIPAVFLAGGIGVTPVRSIALQATHDRLPHKIILFYSNRRPEDAAFLDELAEAQKQNPKFTLVGTMTQMEKSSQAWSGETGFVTQAMLQRSVSDLSVPIFYISGPPAMVAAMRKLLDDSGVKNDRIRTEEFSGY
jgi:ferredoxin-NADP reductase